MSKENTTCKLSAVDDAQTTHGNGGQLISKKPGALLLVSAAYLLGGGGMLAWLGFLLMGPPVLVDVDLGIAGALLLEIPTSQAKNLHAVSSELFHLPYLTWLPTIPPSLWPWLARAATWRSTTASTTPRPRRSCGR